LPSNGAATKLDAMSAWVYMMSNKRNGVLYVGSAINLPRRAWQHREGVAAGFTKRYGLKRLVYAEEHPTLIAARQREMNLKHWPRRWKVQLIHRDNPFWEDLYERLI
jgi:putative endonuclease